MNSFSVLALLLVASGTSHAQYGYGAGMMMGKMGYGYGGMGSMMGMGHHGHHSGSSNNADSNLVLNCLATFTDNAGQVANELAVTIEEKSASSNNHHGLGYGKMGMMGGYGMYGYGGMYGGMYGKGGMYGMSKKNTKLSATIEHINNVAGGTGFVVFTSRANPSGGCSAANFGNVLTEAGHHGKGMGYGMGYSKYGMGYGLGMGYGMGMYGGYGYGMPMGYGMMKPGMMGGHHGPSNNNAASKAGIAAEISIVPGVVTTASVDSLEFDSLKDLAGRGVVICSQVTYDSNGNPQCDEPYFSCCALKYDNKVQHLTATTAPVAP